MRAKFLALASAIGLGLLALTGFRSAGTGQQRLSALVPNEHRDHDRGRLWFHFRHDRDRDHDRR